MIIIRDLRESARTAANVKVKAIKTESGAKTSKKIFEKNEETTNVLSEIPNVEIDQDDNGAGSSGSVGWSDFSEVDVTDTKLSENNLDVAPKKIEDSSFLKSRTNSIDSTIPNASVSVENTKKASVSVDEIKSDLFELAELKSKIRKLETERDSLK